MIANLNQIEEITLPNTLNRIPHLLKRLNSSNVNQVEVYRSLKSNTSNIGLYLAILGKSIKEVKMHSSNSGMLYDFFNTKYTPRKEYFLPTDDLSKIFFSDNVELFNQLNKRKNLVLGSEKGGWMGMQKAMYEIASSDWEGLKETIDYLKSIKGDYDPLFHDIDNYFNIYDAFLVKDKGMLEVALNKLEAESFRKVRQKQIPFEKYISIITTALAKLAWMHGMEVKIDSKYVPQELLPFVPLTEYTIPYKFLRDFYSAEGINWPYDPVYPELQDWANDPENPENNRKGYFRRLFT